MWCLRSLAWVSFPIDRQNGQKQLEDGREMQAVCEGFSERTGVAGWLGRRRRSSFMAYGSELSGYGRHI